MREKTGNAEKELEKIISYYQEREDSGSPYLAVRRRTKGTVRGYYDAIDRIKNTLIIRTGNSPWGRKGEYTEKIKISFKEIRHIEVMPAVYFGFLHKLMECIPPGIRHRIPAPNPKLLKYLYQF